MGALLGHSKEIDHELGFPVAATIAAASTVASLIWGGEENRTCEAQRAKVREDIAKYLTADDRRMLVSGMEDRVKPTASAMAYFYTGEGDCKHKNVGARHQRFIAELPRLVHQRKQEKKNQNSYNGSNFPANMDTSVVAGSEIDPVMLAVAGGSVIAVSVFGYALYKKSKQQKK